MLSYRKEKQTETKIIGIAGAGTHAGCTHMAIMLATGFHALGYKTAVLEDCNHGHFDDIANEYTLKTNHNGEFNYYGVDYYPFARPRALVRLLQKNYDYIVVDHGNFADCDRDFFLTSSSAVICCGSRPWEINNMETVFDALEDETVLSALYYSFPFASSNKALQSQIRRGMDTLKNIVFPAFTENPFRDYDVMALQQIAHVSIPSKGKLLSIDGDAHSAIKRPFLFRKKLSQAAFGEKQPETPESGKEDVPDMIGKKHLTGGLPEASVENVIGFPDFSESDPELEAGFEPEPNLETKPEAKQGPGREPEGEQEAGPGFQPKPELSTESEPAAGFVLIPEPGTEAEAGLEQPAGQEPEPGLVMELEPQDFFRPEPEAASEEQEFFKSEPAPEPELELEPDNEIYCPEAVQESEELFLLARENSKAFAHGALKGEFGSGIGKELYRLQNEMTLAAFGCLLRTAIPHIRTKGKDGHPAIGINSQKIRYNANEEKLRAVLKKDAAYLIYPDSDSFKED